MQLETLFTEMADALRTKEETTDKISAESFPQRIKDLKVLDTTDATATANDIVAGKIAYANGKRVIGTIIDNGALEYTPSNEEQIIPAGKTSGGVVKKINSEELVITPSTEEQIKEGLFNKVIVGPMLDTSDATATAEDILEGKTAYVNGEKVIGTFNPLYTKLEYITSDGNAYIDTGVQALSTIGVELNVKCTNTKATAFFGAWSNEKGIIFGQAYYSSAMQGYAMAANGSWVFADGSSSFNTSIFHKYIYDPINNVYTIDGKTVNLVKNTGLNINMWLFRAYEWSEKGSDISVSSCKIYDNGVLIRDYIPVKRKVDNVACMYDLVNKEFVLPSNGTFIAGPEI